MRMFTIVLNSLREITDFVNRKGITKDQIVGIFELKDGTYSLNYFAKE